MAPESHTTQGSGGGDSRRLIEARGVMKSFGASQALNGFDFDLAPGEIHALIGENGAGKSTFIKMLAGLHEADGGELRVDAERGLAFIHQDLGLVSDLSVADNMALGSSYGRRFGLIDWRSTRRDAATKLELIGVDVDPAAPVESLSMAERALVAIARSLQIGASVLILDEPTATLPGRDVDRLFEVLRRLRGEGLGIIYVSHRLREVLLLADRVTVARDGRSVHVGPAGELTEHRLIELMTGMPLEALELPGPEQVGERILSIEAAGPDDEPIEIAVDAGQVVGCAGLRDAGQERLGRGLFGLVPGGAGEAKLRGVAYRPGSPADALGKGVAYISGSRWSTVAAELTVEENFLMNPEFSSVPGWLRMPGREHRTSEGVLHQFDVRPSDPSLPISALSGGNAQKVVLARSLDNSPSLVLMEDPTAGVDMPTREQLYRVMKEEAASGKGFLLVSSDYDEVARVCDLVHVFRGGKVAATLSEPPFDPERIAAIVAGEADE
jgi:ribose transport system ATP-binding protein